MNPKTKTLAILTLSVALGIQTAFSQTAEELLPGAIQLEEVDGELELAIEAYQAIIDNYPGSKPVAAKAYFHMGMCYEKLGKKEGLSSKKIFQINLSLEEVVVNIINYGFLIDSFC